MKINAISKGLIASLALLGVASCGVETREEQRAEERATKYLTGEEYLKAKQGSGDVSDVGAVANRKMQYWDSLLLVQRADEAYAKGIQMVRDSSAGKEYTKPNFDINFECKSKAPSLILKEVQEEIAKKHNGEEFKKIISEEPNLDENADNRAYKIHYWNNLAIQGAEREAFNRGANEERAKLSAKNLEIDEASALK